MKKFFRTNHLKKHEERLQKKREQLGFREFLIHRFSVILLFVAISEFFVVSLLERYMMPVIREMILGYLHWNLNLSTLDAILLMIILLVEILLTMLIRVVPTVAGNMLQILVIRLEEFAREKIPGLEVEFYNTELEAKEILFLILLVLVTLIFFVIPLIIAAYWFSRIVMDEVRRMEKNKEELRLDYEKKRNLMLSDIAHDLRTPITTISGYAKALNDGMVTDEEKQREYLGAIENKSKRMSELINLLFDYVRMDSTGYSLNLEQVDLAELLRENAALLYPDVEEKQMEFAISIPEERCEVELDTLQFSRVIANLISNAIRHNEGGTIISLEMIREGKEVTVIVSDNGTLIEPKIAEHIFEPFTMGDASRKSKGGSGLGLSIAKKIVEMHGWTIELHQNYGEYKKAFVIKLYLEE